VELENPPEIGADPVPVEIRFATTDDDVIAIHRFLLVVAQPAMHCPVNPEKSLHEIIRVAKFEAAVMAIVDGFLVGTMGIIKPTWWYGDGEFLTDRWHFVLPNLHHGPVNAALAAEAHAIADAAGLKFFHQGKARELKNGVRLMMPRIYVPESANVPPMEGHA
jgi:hypothetical protein